MSELHGVAAIQQHGGVRSDQEPVHTVRSGGRHHGVVIANRAHAVAREACGCVERVEWEASRAKALADYADYLSIVRTPTSAYEHADGGRGASQ